MKFVLIALAILFLGVGALPATAEANGLRIDDNG